MEEWKIEQFMIEGLQTILQGFGGEIFSKPQSKKSLSGFVKQQSLVPDRRCESSTAAGKPFSHCFPWLVCNPESEW